MNINLKSYYRLLPVLGMSLALAGCVDSSFDLSDGHLDKTVKLEAEGIALKFGSTEKIMLKDLIKIENNIVTNADNVYYIVETGSTEVDFKIDPVHTTINQFDLHPDEHLVDGGDLAGQTIHKGETMNFPGISLTGGINTSITDISEDVKSIISVDYGEHHFYFNLLMNQSPNSHFAIKSIKNFKIRLPKDIKSTNADAKNEVHFKDITVNPANSIFLGTVDFKGLDFSSRGQRGYINNGTIDLTNEMVELEADVELEATKDFTIQSNDYISLQLNGKLNNLEVAKLDTKTITGYFDPTIEPEIDPISVRDELPEVLTEGEQHFDIAGTTVRFDVDMTDEPADILVRADINGSGEGHLPAGQGQYATLVGGKKNILYFYDKHDTVNDPDGEVAGAQKYPSDVNNIFVTLPNEVTVNLGEGRVHLADKPTTIEFGRDYNVALDYKFALPFKFNKGFRIEYRDYADEISGDLEDLAAEGIRIVADAANTAPLDLKLTLVAKDINGAELNVDISDVIIKAAPVSQGIVETVTPIDVQIKFANPSDLSRLDKVEFIVEANSQEDVVGGVLRSDMYLQLRDARIKFIGSIIADLND